MIGDHRFEGSVRDCLGFSDSFVVGFVICWTYQFESFPKLVGFVILLVSTF